MKFCEFCENMMYIKVDDNRNLIFYCKNCNNTNTHNKGDGSVMLIHDNKIDDDAKYSQFINENIKYDSTLPHVENIECPNKKCTRGSKKNDVIYIKYDFNNMKYVYNCTYCNEFWKSEN